MLHKFIESRQTKEKYTVQTNRLSYTILSNREKTKHFINTRLKKQCFQLLLEALLQHAVICYFSVMVTLAMASPVKDGFSWGSRRVMTFTTSIPSVTCPKMV